MKKLLAVVSAVTIALTGIALTAGPAAAEEPKTYEYDGKSWTVDRVIADKNDLGIPASVERPADKEKLELGKESTVPCGDAQFLLFRFTVTGGTVYINGRFTYKDGNGELKLDEPDNRESAGAIFFDREFKEANLIEADQEGFVSRDEPYDLLMKLDGTLYGSKLEDFKSLYIDFAGSNATIAVDTFALVTAQEQKPEPVYEIDGKNWVVREVVADKAALGVPDTVSKPADTNTLEVGKVGEGEKVSCGNAEYLLFNFTVTGGTVYINGRFTYKNGDGELKLDAANNRESPGVIFFDREVGSPFTDNSFSILMKLDGTLYASKLEDFKSLYFDFQGNVTVTIDTFSLVTLKRTEEYELDGKTYVPDETIASREAFSLPEVVTLSGKTVEFTPDTPVSVGKSQYLAYSFTTSGIGETYIDVIGTDGTGMGFGRKGVEIKNNITHHGLITLTSTVDYDEGAKPLPAIEKIKITTFGNGQIVFDTFSLVTLKEKPAEEPPVDGAYEVGGKTWIVDDTVADSTALGVPAEIKKPVNNGRVEAGPETPVPCDDAQFLVYDLTVSEGGQAGLDALFTYTPKDGGGMDDAVRTVSLGRNLAAGTYSGALPLKNGETAFEAFEKLALTIGSGTVAFENVALVTLKETAPVKKTAYSLLPEDAAGWSGEGTLLPEKAESGWTLKSAAESDGGNAIRYFGTAYRSGWKLAYDFTITGSSAALPVIFARGLESNAYPGGADSFSLTKAIAAQCDVEPVGDEKNALPGGTYKGVLDLSETFGDFDGFDQFQHLGVYLAGESIALRELAFVTGVEAGVEKAEVDEEPDPGPNPGPDPGGDDDKPGQPSSLLPSETWSMGETTLLPEKTGSGWTLKADPAMKTGSAIGYFTSITYKDGWKLAYDFTIDGRAAINMSFGPSESGYPGGEQSYSLSMAIARQCGVGTVGNGASYLPAGTYKGVLDLSEAFKGFDGFDKFSHLGVYLDGNTIELRKLAFASSVEAGVEKPEIKPGKRVAFQILPPEAWSEESSLLTKREGNGWLLKATGGSDGGNAVGYFNTAYQKGWLLAYDFTVDGNVALNLSFERELDKSAYPGGAEDYSLSTAIALQHGLKPVGPDKNALPGGTYKGVLDLSELFEGFDGFNHFQHLAVFLEGDSMALRELAFVTGVKAGVAEPEKDEKPEVQVRQSLLPRNAWSEESTLLIEKEEDGWLLKAKEGTEGGLAIGYFSATYQKGWMLAYHFTIDSGSATINLAFERGLDKSAYPGGAEDYCLTQAIAKQYGVKLVGAEGLSLPAGTYKGVLDLSEAFEGFEGFDKFQHIGVYLAGGSLHFRELAFVTGAQAGPDQTAHNPGTGTALPLAAAGLMLLAAGVLLLSRKKD